MSQLPYSVPKFIVWAMSLFILVVIYQDFALGGHEWKQGDWLINNDAIAVRRGIMGSALLRVSELASLDVIVVITALQGILVGLCIILISIAIGRSNFPGTLWLLALSPAFFVNFWAVDPAGALRKELIVFLAFSVLLYATTQQTISKALLALTTVIYGVAVFSHEGNVFFAPFFLFSFVLIHQKGHIARPFLIALLAVTIAVCVGAMLLALSYSGVDDHLLVCQPLLDAGVRPGICDGAIKALELDLSFFLEATFWMVLSPSILSFLLMYGLAAISILAIGLYFFERKPFLWLVIGSALFFLPLYAVAVDWGRWLSFHASAVIFAMMIVLSLSPQKWINTPELPRGPFMALTLFCVIWGCTHFVSVAWGGIFGKVVAGLIGAA